MRERFKIVMAALLALMMSVFLGAEPDQKQLPFERDMGDVCAISDTGQAPMVLADVGACDPVPRSMMSNEQLFRKSEPCVQSKHLHDPG